MLDDLIATGLRLLICGNAVGSRSAEEGLYYAGRGNKLWLILAQLGMTSERLKPCEYRRLLNDGIGLTDLVKDQAGADARVRACEADRHRLRALVARHRPRLLAFNGKRAARSYGPSSMAFSRSESREFGSSSCRRPVERRTGTGIFTGGRNWPVTFAAEHPRLGAPPSGMPHEAAL